MNIMTVDNFRAVISYDDEISMFRGEILDLSGGADFYAKSVDELRKEFRISLEVYIEACRESGIAPFMPTRQTELT